VDILIDKLKKILDKKTKRSLYFLVLFSVFISVVEVVTISAIMPFIDVATDFSKIQEVDYYKYIYDFFLFDAEVDFAIYFGITLFVFYLIRGAFVHLYNYKMALFSGVLYFELTKKLFKTYMFMPYSVFSRKNSSFLTKAIVTEASLLSVVVNAVLLMISEVFIVVFLYICELAVEIKRLTPI
jgi:ABC-type multidrug transport system fused ATPase/permease subunit